jgi:hypothetical protein
MQGSDELLTIDSAIKSRMGQLNKLKNDLKVQKEMLDSFLENDEKYCEAVELSKKANGVKNAVKAQLLKQPEAANLNETIKAIKEQVFELNEGLSYYLREYQRLTGANEFEGEDGELQQIIYVAKLVRKTRLNK